MEFSRDLKVLRLINDGCTYEFPICAYLTLQMTYTFLTTFGAIMFTLCGQLHGAVQCHQHFFQKIIESTDEFITCKISI